MRTKKCRICNKEFKLFKSTQVVCSVPCALEYGKRKERAKDQKLTRQKKKELLDNDISHWRKKAQFVFNRYIRLRDKLNGCISCGTMEGQFHAGHYRSVGAHPELRFEELNCHKQCARCNNYYSGNLVDYRINLINKIGLKNVVWLEGQQPQKKYNIKDYKAIYSYYTSRIKELSNV